MKLYTKLLEILEAHDVNHIFGVPGDAINPLLEALRKQDSIKYVHVAHEESGAMAASASAKLTGKLQVCAGTVGPGAIHLLNGLYDAKKDHAPVLAIVGQVPSQYIGSDYHQEVNLPVLFHDVADYITEIQNPEQMPDVAIEACNSAVANHSVSVLVIPYDVGQKDVPDLPVTAVTQDLLSPLKPQDERIQDAVDKINNAGRISLFVGEGARGSRDQVLKLAEQLQAPIIFSLKAKDIIPYDHPNTAGGLGLLGSRAGVRAMDDCDLVLMLGSDFPYKEWFNHDGDVIQVDRRASVVGRRRPGAVAIHSDVGPAVGALLSKIHPRSNTDFLQGIQKVKKEWDAFLHEQEAVDRSKNVVHPQAVAATLSEIAEPDTIFTCDTGEVTVWGARHLYLKKDQRFTLAFNLATMAYAMPASIGTQCAYPDRQVISLSGDGGFNMLMGDFLTAVKYKLPIKVVVFNNGKLGLIKMEQESEGYPEHETDLQNPNYAALANAMGGHGFKVNGPAELRSVLQEALKTDGPCLVDVPINPDELTLPPKITLSQAFGFGLAKFRELLESR